MEMTTKQAVKAWGEMKASVTPSSLNNVEKHQRVHDIFAAINRARLSGELTTSQLENL